MSVFSNTSKDAPELRAQYAAAVLGLVGERARSGRASRDAGGRRARRRDPHAGKTTHAGSAGQMVGRQVLRHLADTDVVWGWRMRLILAQDRPAITGFDQDLWADRLDYANADPNESLETFAVLRRDNLRLIERATPEDLAARRRACRARRRERRVSRAPLRRPRPDAPQSDRSHHAIDYVGSGFSRTATVTAADAEVVVPRPFFA